MIWLDEGGIQRNARLIPPPPSLVPFVSHFVVQGAVSRPVWRVVPDTCAHLLFAITNGPDGRRDSCKLVGARGVYFDAPVGQRVLTIAARLRVGVLPLVLRDTAIQLTDRGIPLADIAGRAATRLMERMEAADTVTAVGLLAEFLAERLDNHRAPGLCPSLLRQAASVEALARALGNSRRRVYRRFLQDVGLAPKRALRVLRLHRALSALNQGKPLARAAAEAHFADQAHFTRESVRLLGETPAVWRGRGRPFVQDNHA